MYKNVFTIPPQREGLMAVKRIKDSIEWCTQGYIDFIIKTWSSKQVYKKEYTGPGIKPK